jgi:hypothetical protein
MQTWGSFSLICYSSQFIWRLMDWKTKSAFHKKLFIIEKDSTKVMKFGDKSGTEDDQEFQDITDANCICSEQSKICDNQ